MSQLNPIHIAKKEIDIKQFVKRSAFETDYERLITDDTVVYVDGKPAILYQKLTDWDFAAIENVLQNIEYQTSTRTSGLKTTSRVFGYQPRIPLRRDFCTKTSLASQDPLSNKVICDYGTKIVPLYEAAFPEVFKAHAEAAATNVKQEWQIERTPFTSGIVNKNNPLKYHFDAGNFKDVCSCMLVFKRDVAGGFLSVPELNIGFELVNRSLLIFDGQSLLHGVTPIKKLSGQAYRYSVVYYSLQQMWKCEPLSAELARIRQVKTQREKKRAQKGVSNENTRN